MAQRTNHPTRRVTTGSSRRLNQHATSLETGQSQPRNRRSRQTDDRSHRIVASGALALSNGWKYPNQEGLKRLINSYLKASISNRGQVEVSSKGTPQGGPLSPLLSNILLDSLDKELERRGLSFSRYADDCNIYVNSRRAGERVLESVSRMVEGPLKLKVNREKSAVARPWARTFLGFTFRKIWGKMRICVPEHQWQSFRKKVRESFGAGRGQNLKRFVHGRLNPILRGWYGYFRLGVSRKALQSHDFWVRRRLRCVIWRQWK